MYIKQIYKRSPSISFEEGAGGYELQDEYNIEFDFSRDRVGYAPEREEGNHLWEKFDEDGVKVRVWYGTTFTGGMPSSKDDFGQIDLTISAGFDWNGASGVPDTDDLIEPSLVHDALYLYIRKGPYRWHKRDRKHFKKVADAIFLELCALNGVSWLRRKVLGLGLKLFGKRATTAKAARRRVRISLSGTE